MSQLDDLVSIFTQISLSRHQSITKHDLILDRELSPYLNYLTHNKFSSFSQNANIDKVTWFPQPPTIDSHLISFLNSSNPIVFLITLQSDESFIKFKTLKSLINNHDLFPTDREINLIVHHPTLDTSIETYLSNSGILGDFNSFNIWSSQLSVQLSSTNPQIISLEYNNDSAFKHLYLDNSPLPLEMLANLLLELHIKENYRLRITNLFLKGFFSEQFWKIYQRLLSSHLQSLSDIERKKIEDIDETIFMDVHSFYNNSTDLICLDRSNDLISCLLSQLSYSGLCNDHFNLQSQLSSITLNDNNNSLHFNLYDDNDEIYNSIKYLNFSHVGPILNYNAKSLQNEFDRRNHLKDIDEIKSFVNELNHLKQLQSNVTKHTNIAQEILSTFNNNINMNTNIPLLDELEPPNDDIFSFSVNSYQSQLLELQQDILSNQFTISQIISKVITLINIVDDVSHLDVFKLLIITSITKSGFRESDFLPLFDEMTFKYGLEQVLPILLNLQKLSLIQFNDNGNQPLSSFLKLSNNNTETKHSTSKSQSISNFQSLVKSLNLMPLHENNDIDNDVHSVEKSPTIHNSLQDYDDADFAYPGYVPVFTRLIESIYSRSFLNPEQRVPSTFQSSNSRAIKYGWNNLDALSNDFLTSTTIQKFLVPDSKKKLFNSIIPPKINDLQNHGTIIICAIGGITWSEIATIKYVLDINPLTKQKKIIILTTGIITSNQLIKTLSKPV